MDDKKINRDLHPDEEFLRLKVEAICLDAQKKMQADAITGAKRIIAVTSALFTALVTIVSFLGYETYTEKYNDIIEKYSEIEKKSEEINIIKGDVKSLVENAQLTLAEIDKLNLKGKYLEINDSHRIISESEKKLAELVKSIDKQKELMKHLRRGALDIAVHYSDKNTYRKNSVLKSIEEQLDENGYWVNLDKVQSYSADATEVVYYSAIVKPYAIEIAKILSGIYHNKTIYATPNFSNRIAGSGDVLIKIKME